MSEGNMTPGRTFTRSDGSLGCDECCTGDRCDDPTHRSRENCPYCLGSGTPKAPEQLRAGETPVPKFNALTELGWEGIAGALCDIVEMTSEDYVNEKMVEALKRYFTPVADTAEDCKSCICEPPIWARNDYQRMDEQVKEMTPLISQLCEEATENRAGETTHGMPTPADEDCLTESESEMVEQMVFGETAVPDDLKRLHQLSKAGRAWIRTADDIAIDEGGRISPHPAPHELIERIEKNEAEIRELRSELLADGEYVKLKTALAQWEADAYNLKSDLHAICNANLTETLAAALEQQQRAEAAEAEVERLKTHDAMLKALGANGPELLADLRDALTTAREALREVEYVWRQNGYGDGIHVMLLAALAATEKGER